MRMPRNSPAHRIAGIVVGVGIVLAAVAACSAFEFGEPAPLSTAQPNAAVRERIRAFEADARPPVLDVTSFVGPDDRPVYLFTPLCCDQFNPLYDAEGRFICAPSGGFGGAGDGKCPAWAHGVARKLRLPQPPGEQSQPPR
ncbi:DUF6970 domain-containing protein [Roseateles sp.]|uniref:DUF6970 domain-containing protein n=1 Tax=Roseateles sp. TaxID=1971397 RepID=UPI003267BB9D